MLFFQKGTVSTITVLIFCFTYIADMLMSQLMQVIQCGNGGLIAVAENLVILGVHNDFGLKVPDDLSVISIDDIETVSYLSPMLTTVRIPIEEMGAMAVSQIQKILDCLFSRLITAADYLIDLQRNFVNPFLYEKLSLYLGYSIDIR